MQTKINQLSRGLTPIATALFLAVVPYSAMAEKHDQEMKQHGSHEHGAARLTVAAIDDGLEISLESPAANVFGFEHKANSEAEHHVVHEALETLKDGSVLFVVNEAAACKLEKANVKSVVAESHDEHDHNAPADGEDSHSDIEAGWVYHCDKPDAIETVTVKLFSAFPKGFEDIDVEWITASNAGKAELEEDGMVSLKP